MKSTILLLTITILSIVQLFSQQYEVFSQGNLKGVRDANQKVIIEAKYEDVNIFEEQKVFSFTLKNKSGLLSEKGELLVQPGKNVFFYICEDAKEYLFIEGKTSYIYNTKTREFFQLDENYDKFELKDNSCYIDKGTKLKFIQNGKTGLLEFPQNIILLPVYDEMFYMPHYEKVYLTKIGKRYKFYDTRTKSFTQEFEVKNADEIFRFDNNECYLNMDDIFAAKFGSQWYLTKIDTILNPIEKYEQVNFDYAGNDATHILSKKNGKYGFIESTGYELLPFIYDDANWFEDNITSVKINGKYGGINKSGETVILFLYDSIGRFDGYKAKARIKDKKFEIDDMGEYKGFLASSYNEKTGKYGFTDSKKKIIIDYKFDDALDFTQGLAPVNIGKNETETGYTNGKWGYINYAGEFVIECKYDQANNFYNGVAKVKNDGKEFFINTAGELVFSKTFDEAKDLFNGFAAVKIDNKWGFMNQTGKLVINNDYEAVGYFNDSLANVKLNGKWGYINTQGKMVIENIYENCVGSSGILMPVCMNGKWGYINRKGEKMIDFIYESAGNFYSNKASVKKDGETFNINEKGEKIK